MLIYLLKFSACLFLFLAFYKLFLERESFHKLKRFYLLAALLLALSIPLITFTEYVEVTPKETVANTFIASDTTSQDSITETSWKDYLPNIILGFYILGCLVFGFRFIKHLSQLYFKIKRNPKLKTQKFTNVLLSDAVNPHTFFKYIFLNKNKFEQHLIPKEVLLHEQTHAKQLHALDIMIVEFFQIMFWFHPLLYLIKRDIKLNHEFLADQSVINAGAESSYYQKLLLAFSSSATEHPLANAINYSSIKKRLTIMKTQTTRSRTWIKSFLLLPLLAVLIYSFSSEKVEYMYPSKVEALLESHPNIELYMNSKGVLFYKNFIIKVDDLANIQPLENDMNVSIETALETDLELTKAVSKSIQEYLRNQGLKGFSVCFTASADSNDSEATPEQIITYNTLAKKYNKQPEASRVIKLKDLKQLETIYRVMSEKQKKQAESFPNCPPSLNQEGATKSQLKEYNTLAKKYNAMSRNNMIVHFSDVKRLKQIYGLMSLQQRKNAEPFPDFPNPPETPDAPRALDAPSAQTHIELSPPPPPPPPKDPLDHIVDMAKKNAEFYLEGKLISSDKAIKALKKNKGLNIQIKGSDSKQPKVYITKKPIQIKKSNPF